MSGKDFGSTPKPASSKRKCAEMDDNGTDIVPSDPSRQTDSRKCTVKEGFSWWTCLMYDMPQQNTKPQPVHKGHRMDSNFDDFEETIQCNSDSLEVLCKNKEEYNFPMLTTDAVSSVIDKDEVLQSEHVKENYDSPCEPGKPVGEINLQELGRPVPHELCQLVISVTNLPCDTNMPERDIVLPHMPTRPLDIDCCGSGCVPCVFDIYEQEMKIWQKECERIQEKAYLKGDKCDSMLVKEEYHEFTIASVTEETKNSRRFRVSLPNGRSLGLKIGQHVIIRDGYHGETITRQYTPVSDVTCKGYFELIIKIYKEGKMSKCAKSWMPGSVIKVRGPYGEFVYHPSKYKSIQMLAAGTGIAPMAQVIQGILGNEDDETIIKLFYACRTYQDIVMKDELKDWRKYWNFSVVYVISQEQSACIEHQYAYGDVVYRGHLDQAYLTSQWQEHVWTDKDLVLVCGTTSFNRDMKQYCTDLGVNIDNIFVF